MLDFLNNCNLKLACTAFHICDGILSYFIGMNSLKNKLMIYHICMSYKCVFKKLLTTANVLQVLDYELFFYWLNFKTCSPWGIYFKIFPFSPFVFSSTIGDGLGEGYGMLGQAGNGKLRVSVGQSKLAAKVAKK